MSLIMPATPWATRESAGIGKGEWAPTWGAGPARDAGMESARGRPVTAGELEAEEDGGGRVRGTGSGWARASGALGRAGDMRGRGRGSDGRGRPAAAAEGVLALNVLDAAALVRAESEGPGRAKEGR